MWFCLPGEIFGLAECITGNTRKVYAQTCNDVTILSISDTDFKSFLAQHPNAALQVIELLSSRMRTLSNTLLSITTNDVTTRVKHILCRLNNCYGVDIDDIRRIEILITHQEIANMIGTSRQSVTTIINQFRKAELLYVKDRKFYLYKNIWNQIQHDFYNDEKNINLSTMSIHTKNQTRILA